MLINFKFKNVFSFKELQEFSMAAGSTIRNSDRLAQYNKNKILKFASIFGANASGKSNFVKAISLMKNIVKLGLPPYYLNYYYKLQDVNKMDPSYFEVTMLINNKLYDYGFELNMLNNTFESEWLYEVKNDNNYIPLFEREIGKKIYFNPLFGKELLYRLNFYGEDVAHNNHVLLLNFLNKDKPTLFEYKKADILKDVYNWFSEQLDIASPETIITRGNEFTIEEKLKQLEEILKFFDTGIKKIFNKEVEYDQAIKEIPAEVIRDIIQTSFYFMNEINRNDITNLIKINKNLWIIKVRRDGTQDFEKLCFYHDKNNKYEFDLSNESDGTARVIELSTVLMTDEKNKVFVIDELDRCLHPQLTRKFVEIFLQNAKEKDNNNQLIVTTHETCLLDFDLVRRDEVWFVAKEENQSTLYSLEEYNVRFDKKIDKAYMEGRFGGVPRFYKHDECPLKGIVCEDENCHK